MFTISKLHQLKTFNVDEQLTNTMEAVRHFKISRVTCVIIIMITRLLIHTVVRTRESQSPRSLSHQSVFQCSRAVNNSVLSVCFRTTHHALG